MSDHSSDDSSDEDFIPDNHQASASECSEGEAVTSESESESQTKPKSTSKRKRVRPKEVPEKKSKLNNEKDAEASKADKDKLWAEFLSGTEQPKKPVTTATKDQPGKSTEPSRSDRIFDGFDESRDKPSTNLVTIPKVIPKIANSKSGFSSILEKFGKKSKVSVLERSKLDWDKFKEDEGIKEELQSFNRGKDGYLERQEFLQRTDLRLFEQEKQLRSTTRKN